LKILSCIFSALLLVSISTTAQVKQEKDSVEKMRLTAVRLSGDIVNIIKSNIVDDFSGWEAAVDVELKNYYPILEIGSWSRDVNLANGHYTNSGNFWRLGVDVNLLKKDPVKNTLFFGIRYGRSTYDERLDYRITTKEFGPEDKSLENLNMKAGFLELTTGLRVKVIGGFWMGYTGRLKFAPGVNESNQLQSYDVPGYGLTYKQPWWGFNYYLMWKLNIKKRPTTSSP
jgi:hypothetical protein